MTATTRQYDPEIAPLVPHIPALVLDDVAGARAGLVAQRAAMPAADLPPSVEVTRRSISHDGVAVDVLITAPSRPTGPAPLLLWFHGGGFVLGDAEMDLATNAARTAEFGALVVSVDYALAPEHPFPVAHDQGHAALGWIVAHAEELGVDLDRLAIGGQSAGACLAAGLALRVRDEGGPTFRLQALEIPVIDDRLATSSMEYSDTLMWNRPNAEVGWQAYLGRSLDARADDPTVPAYAAPGRAADVAGLPPTFVSTCQWDPLRDEGIGYAQRLVQVGVPTELHLYPGTFHGSAGVAPEADVSRRMRRDLADALARALTTPGGSR